MSEIPRCAFAGLGVTPQGRLDGESSIDIKVNALRLALEDAGLAQNEVDGYIYAPGMVDIGVYGTGGEVIKRVGLSPNFVWEVQSGGTSALACVSMACWAIERGMARYVAINYGDAAATGKVLVGEAGGVGGGEAEYDTHGAYGMYSPGADHALAAKRHMHLYGTTKEQLGTIALPQREYANQRSDAVMRDRTLTMEDYLGARPIADPLGKFDYCLVADGGSAFIVTTADRARALRPKPVLIEGQGLSAAFADVHDRTQYDHIAVSRARDQAFAQAGVTVEDIDVAQLYDCFTPTVLLAIEGYGFCPKGEGGPFIADGNLRLNGAIPTNTAGGELSWSYQQGFTPLIEGLRQLRGESGATQATGAETCLVTGHGGVVREFGNMDYVESCAVLRADR